jgi:hypothetical protein
MERDVAFPSLCILFTPQTQVTSLHSAHLQFLTNPPQSFSPDKVVSQSLQIMVYPLLLMKHNVLASLLFLIPSAF